MKIGVSIVRFLLTASCLCAVSAALQAETVPAGLSIHSQATAHSLAQAPVLVAQNDDDDDDDDDKSQKPDTGKMVLDGARKISELTQCLSNCNARLSSCNTRCRSYQNRDPRGVACVMDCSNNSSQCRNDCNNR